MDQQTLIVVALLMVGPALMVWTARERVQARHAAIYAVLAVLLGAAAYASLVSLRPGQGMFGLLLGGAGICAAALAIAFLSAAASVAIAIASRSGPSAAPSRERSPHQPLTDEYREWQRSTNRPHASYQDFLHGANFRRFPASAVTLLVGLVLMVVVFVLILRR